ELANRFFDVITVQKAGSALAVDALGLVLQTAMGLCLLAFYHPLLLAFDVLLVLLLIAVIAIPARAGITTALAESKAKYATAAWLETVAGSPTLFRAAEPTDLAASRADALARRYLGARSAHWQKLVTQIAGGLGLQVIASVALLGVGGWLVINRQLTLGQLVAAELVVAAIGTGFAKLGKQLEKLYDAVAAVDKIGHVVDAERERDGGLRIDGHGPMALSLRQVRRAGEGGPELLEVIDLEVAPQGRVAVTGPSGSGKTTLLQLVAGLRAPSEGAVVASGVDLGHADLLLYRQAVAFLDEEALPNLSIGDYLRLGRNDASSETLRAALRKVSLEERVVRLPRGLDTMLLANGGPLSRTEARRLRLARALVQRPRLLIVDDLLDDLGLLEGAREALLDEVMGPHAPWTLMVSSSDPAVVSRCEQVLALEDHR
ncbi:MAG: ATP-binding cassette domain-containing protein, partial [Myxococcales bacterium]|nr:ATP-binding cassette domain-containing protein [Myxococcales bacterium]